MKKSLCLCIVAAMTLFIASVSLSGAVAPKKHMGIQVYSVKGFESDVTGSLKALSDDGYTVLEIANYDANTGLVAGYKPAEFAALVKKYGMEVISSHAGAKFDTKDEAGTLAAWGKIFIANTDPGKVFFEMDVYWITQGGQDPVAYLKKYPSRFKELHIKDEYVVGATGKIDFKEIFTQFYKNGYEDWFVEMEAKMTPEEREQSKGMMDAMKQIQAKGGTMQDLMAELSKNPPKGVPGFGAPQDPKVVAEQLKTSLDGIKESADYLLKSEFVK